MDKKQTPMKNRLTLLFALTLTFFISNAYANPIQYFKVDGRTNWQYVANFSSAVLIILLSFTALTLFFSRLRTKQANRELREIREALEQRVLERTATLAESNSRLQDEVAKHKKTSELLLVSETYIKNILASMPSMLIGLDSNMNITQWNLSAEETTGTLCEKALNRNLWEVYPTITLSKAQIEKVINENKPATIKHNQRGQYYFEITIYPLKDHIDSGVVILIDNVTQRSIAENKLIQRDKMSSMGELASSMAHDIDMPLQAIFKDLNDLQQALNTSTPKIQSTLIDATEKAQQASQIIRNLLDFSQNNDRKKKPENIIEIIDHTLELAKITFATPSGLHFKNITIEKDYQDQIPEIPCYKAELQQVFLNLFRHACHALGNSEDSQRTPTIKIKIITCYDSLWIKIQHNGLGLTGSEQHEIFEPFFHDQLSPKNTRTENRLSFTQFIIVEHHQGHIFVTSDVEVGTTFHMEFQLA